MGFPRQEYWSGLPHPSPGDLPDRGIKPESPALADGFLTTEPTRGKTTEARPQSIRETKKQNQVPNPGTHQDPLCHAKVHGLFLQVLRATEHLEVG